MCERDTVGTVPDAPGLYGFTVASRPGMRLGVMYLGMTTHLSMVTKGILLEVAGPEVGSATVVPPMPAPHGCPSGSWRPVDCGSVTGGVQGRSGGPDAATIGNRGERDGGQGQGGVRRHEDSCDKVRAGPHDAGRSGPRGTGVPRSPRRGAAAAQLATPGLRPGSSCGWVSTGSHPTSSGIRRQAGQPGLVVTAPNSRRGHHVEAHSVPVGVVAEAPCAKCG